MDKADVLVSYPTKQMNYFLPLDNYTAKLLRIYDVFSDRHIPRGKQLARRAPNSLFYIFHTAQTIPTDAINIRVEFENGVGSYYIDKNNTTLDIFYNTPSYNSMQFLKYERISEPTKTEITPLKKSFYIDATDITINDDLSLSAPYDIEWIDFVNPYKIEYNDNGMIRIVYLGVAPFLQTTTRNIHLTTDNCLKISSNECIVDLNEPIANIQTTLPIEVIIDHYIKFKTNIFSEKLIVTTYQQEIGWKYPTEFRGLYQITDNKLNKNMVWVDYAV